MIPSLYTSILYCWHNNNNNNKHGVYDGVIMTVIDTALSNITPRRLQYTAVGDATLKWVTAAHSSLQWHLQPRTPSWLQCYEPVWSTGHPSIDKWSLLSCNDAMLDPTIQLSYQASSSLPLANCRPYTSHAQTDRVVKYLKYKYLIRIWNTWQVFCILAKFEMYFIFKYKKFWIWVFKIHVNCQIQSTTKKSIWVIRLNYINTIKLIYKQ